MQLMSDYSKWALQEWVSCSDEGGREGGRDMGQRVTEGVVGDRALHSSMNVLYCHYKRAYGGHSHTDFLDLIDCFSTDHS